MLNYELVGSRVEVGDVRLCREDVTPLHDLTSRDLFLEADKAFVEFDDSLGRYSVSYAFMFENGVEAESVFTRFVAIKLEHTPDNWRLLVGLRTFNSGDRHSNKRIIYTLEVGENDVIEAKKKVFLLLGRSAIYIDEYGQLVEEDTVERKMYERPMRPDDATKVRDILIQTLKRRKATN